jgi:hypothetical protein
MPQTIEFPDVVACAIDIALQGLWTAMPGIVESYDATQQTANIQIAVQSVSVGESGDTLAETIAVLNAVPVVHVGGAGFRAVFPPTRGDTALVVFCSRSIERWIDRGGVVDPFLTHHHDLSDGVAIVGLRTRQNPLSSSPSDHASIGHDHGATIEFREDEIRIGGDAGTQPTFKGPDLNSALQDMFQEITDAFKGLPEGIGAGAATAVQLALAKFQVAADRALTTVAKVV